MGVVKRPGIGSGKWRAPLEDRVLNSSDPKIGLSKLGFPAHIAELVDQSPVIYTTSEWRKRLSAVEQMDFEQLQDCFYAAGLNGATFNQVCDYFGIKDGDSTQPGKFARYAAELRTAHQLALVELQMRLRALTVANGLNPKSHPVAKIWADKNFGGMSDNGLVETLGVTGEGTAHVGGLFISIKARRNEDGTTTGPALEQAVQFDAED